VMANCFCCYNVLLVIRQGDHLSGKPGNVREFDRCQRNDQKSVTYCGKVT